MFERRQPFYRPDEGDESAGSAALEGALSTDALDLAQVRELVLLAHPDVIPELVSGTTFDELIGSVETARAAYLRIVESVQSSNNAAPAESAAPKIPAGGGQRQVSVNVEQLSPAAKISEGLRRRHRRGA